MTTREEAKGWFSCCHIQGRLDRKVLVNNRICSRHFISGKPAALYNDTNPDWLPTLHLGHAPVSCRLAHEALEEVARLGKELDEYLGTRDSIAGFVPQLPKAS